MSGQVQPGEYMRKIEHSDVSGNGRLRLIAFLLDNVIWVFNLVLIIVLSIFIPYFFSVTTALNILNQLTWMGLLVFGEAICLIVGKMDLSVDAIVLFSSFATAFLMIEKGLSAGLGIPLVIVIGTAIGVFNGYAIGYLHINPFLQTMGSFIVFRQAVFSIHAASLAPTPAAYSFLGSGRIGGVVPASIVLLFMVAAVLHILLTRTAFGRHLYAVGGNAEAARASGINVKKIVFLAFCISGFLGGLSGLVLSGRTGGVYLNTADGAVFYVFAGAILGGASLSGGSGSIPGMLGGVILLGLIDTGLTLGRVDIYVINVVRGLLVSLALVVDRFRFYVKKRAGIGT